MLRNRVDSHNFAAWFRGLTLERIDDATLVVGVQNLFAKDLIEKRFMPTLTAAAKQAIHADAKVEVVFKVRKKTPLVDPPVRSDASEPDATKTAPAVERESESVATNFDDADLAENGRVARSVAPRRQPQRSFRLNEDYTFENFVVGPSAQFCHAACIQVVSAPARSYNPLFIHGASGLGKTHLLQATSRALMEREPGLRLLYISCEDFMNRFVRALDDRSLPKFRNELRSLDCLVIDDIHFLARKKGMQEEFFHTFNALYDKQKQIILSADSRPHDMPHFEERLLSRFQWGLLASVEPPTETTRRTILRRKAAAMNRELPDDVIDLLAAGIDRNVRALEGAVLKLIATADLCGGEIDVDLVRSVVSDLNPVQVRTPKPAEITGLVADAYGVTVPELRSAGRTRRLVVPRQLAMLLTKTLTSLSLKEIGKHFGNRDHTTVLHGIQRAEKLVAEDQRARDVVADVQRAFQL